jgi:RNA polymerase sigma-70 factor, ECF subfamily
VEEGRFHGYSARLARFFLGMTAASDMGLPAGSSRSAPGPGTAQAQPYQPGSRDDFDRLYSTTYQRIFATMLVMLGNRAAAEDCAQEAFVRAFRAWPRWRPDAPAEAWVHRIAINVAISARRQERLREVGQLIRRLGVPVTRDPTDEALGSLLLRELRALPHDQAAALVLRHYHGYTNREIGHALGVPERTVASRLMRARAKLQAQLPWHDGGGSSPPAGVSSGE